MKSILSFIAISTLLVLSACSSGTKKETTTESTTVKETTAPKTATTTETKTTTASEAKKETKKSKMSLDAKKEMAATELTCKSNSEERTLAIVTKDAGCELKYTKSAETKVIASQVVGNKKCEEVLEKVKQNLVSAKYECVTK